MSHPLRGIFIRDIPATRRLFIGACACLFLLAVLGRQPPVSHCSRIGRFCRDLSGKILFHRQQPPGPRPNRHCAPNASDSVEPVFLVGRVTPCAPQRDQPLRPPFPSRGARFDTDPAGEVAIPPRVVQREPLRFLFGWKRGFIFDFWYFFLWDLNPVLCFDFRQAFPWFPGRPEGRPGLPTCLFSKV
jgi:hypothetical protein